MAVTGAGRQEALERVEEENLAMSFYLKKTYVDNQPGIELVNIHYTWTPMNTPPNWDAHRETRVMPRGGTLIRGMGGTTLDEHGQSVQTTTDKIELPDDGVRRKILSLPQERSRPVNWSLRGALPVPSLL
jgi:hypothetical protein